MSIIKLADVTADHNRFPYVCADTETTGFGPHAEVVEITCIEHDIQGNTGAMITYLCEPLSGFIPPEASNVNHIYMEDVRGYPPYLTGGVREDVIGFLGYRTLVAHNADFDIEMMRIKPKDVYCTLKESRKRDPQRKHKLTILCRRLGIEWDETQAHRAEYDVRKTIEVFAHFHGYGKDKEATLMRIQTELF